MQKKDGPKEKREQETRKVMDKEERIGRASNKQTKQFFPALIYCPPYKTSSIRIYNINSSKSRRQIFYISSAIINLVQFGGKFLCIF